MRAFLKLLRAKDEPKVDESLDFIAVATLMSAVRTLQLTVAEMDARLVALEGKSS